MLKNSFSVVCKLFKLCIAFFGLCKLNKLNLIELMLTNETSCVSAGGACLCSEAC